MDGVKVMLDGVLTEIEKGRMMMKERWGEMLKNGCGGGGGGGGCGECCYSDGYGVVLFAVLGWLHNLTTPAPPTALFPILLIQSPP